MTQTSARLAAILAEYTSAMDGIQRAKEPAPDRGDRPRRVLQPADRQRSCGSPRIAEPAAPRSWLK
ncbi:MAG: hypothetical protein JWR37_3623 [Mycobacterium sp.]|nr:hypothetical protein [Mycobacterium sp.]